MKRIARKSDGRRIFTDAFKRQHMDRVWRGEVTISELSRRLGIARSLLQRWKRLMPQGARAAVPARGRISLLRPLAGEQYIRELQLLVGRQTVELELLRAELEALKRERRSSRAAVR